MAWMEMRILIAKMVFLLDYELVDDKLDWERDSPAYSLCGSRSCGRELYLGMFIESSMFCNFLLEI
jgi:hypothetical protein